jgi:cytochrome c biogenesis protein CcdA
LVKFILFRHIFILCIELFRILRHYHPSWIANKSAKAEEAGGLIGIFFMAFTLVIVSFSCTGPILGSLLGGVLVRKTFLCY